MLPTAHWRSPRPDESCHILPALLQYCPGLPIKLVSGYKASQAIALAFARREVDALALPLDSLRTVYPEILEETMIAQSGLARARHERCP